MKSNSKTMGLISLAVLVSLALATATKPDVSATSSLASKLLPAQTKARTSRSISDMFEKMRSKIFGSRKQSSPPAGAQPNFPASPSAASANVGQRQPWGDLNSFNSQYSPYAGYQFPSQGSQFSGQQYGSAMGAYSSGAFPQMSINAQGQLQAGGPMEANQQVAGSQGPLNSPAAAASASSAAAGQQQPAQQAGGLLSSASHLIAQYLSPSGVGSGQQQPAGQQPASGPQQQQPQASLMSPQSQSQYNEFASILDSMVAQTGNAVQRQPNLQGQYMQGPQQQQPQQQQQANQQMGADQDMSGSSLSQSYSLPSGANSAPLAQPAASAKSSMVSLAEQLAPGAQFNKLVSFPFSISNNDDSNKEGRYKLHIPFLNQHVKRSDQQQHQHQQHQHQQSQQQQVASVGQRQVAPQYLSAHYQQAAPSGPQQTVQQQQQQSSSSVMLSQGSAAVGGQQQQQQAANNRPAWSVADLQAAASAPTAVASNPAPSQTSSAVSPAAATAAASSSAKLIPMASASSGGPGELQAAPAHQ